MKKSLVPTFFITFFVAFVLLFTLLALVDPGTYDVLSMMGMMNRSNFMVLWLVIDVSGIIAIIFTILNFVDNMRLNRSYQNDLRRLNANLEPHTAELREFHKKMQKMSGELQELSGQKNANKAEIIENERKRISRELHDSVSQELFAATMILSSVTSAANLSKEQIMTQSNLTLKILHEAQNEMRALLLHLRPIELDGKSLLEGLKALTDELQNKISSTINVKLTDIQASNNIEDNLFRMAQEILSNTLKHAQANHIEVNLGEKYGNIILRIKDDGVGFDVNKEKVASYGLSNIKERALSLGGDIKIISAPNQGTIVEIRIPKVGKD